MTKLEIFDPAMCCPTGVCGPSVDPELTRVSSTLFILEKKGLDIARYNLASDPAKFVENTVINALLHEKGPDSLPAVVLNGEIVKIGIYPTNQELADWFELDIAQLSQKESKTRLI
ncbi:arsenite efflux transporter metallochaperone ArsD [Bacillus sp. DJP31]|uniref:arsenite efflux transporter metallochaperone ArsD n=1 Tax=Bacillus sp. DJP31 TaxID=3409789 RepID=UPI003BB6CB43